MMTGEGSNTLYFSVLWFASVSFPDFSFCVCHFLGSNKILIVYDACTLLLSVTACSLMAALVPCSFRSVDDDYIRLSHRSKPGLYFHEVKIEKLVRQNKVSLTRRWIQCYLMTDSCLSRMRNYLGWIRVVHLRSYVYIYYSINRGCCRTCCKYKQLRLLCRKYEWHDSIMLVYIIYATMLYTNTYSSTPISHPQSKIISFS